MPTGYEIMQRAAILLNDTKYVRWTAPELCVWINEGVRAIVLAKPSSSSKTLSLKMNIGTYQTINPYGLLPASTTLYTAGAYPLVLLDIERNVVMSRDVNGALILSESTGLPVVSNYGRTIKRVDGALLDAQAPGWHSNVATQRKQEVRNYVFDERVPTEFHVYPPNNGAGWVQAKLGVLPQPVKAVVPATGQPNPNNLTVLTPLSYNQNVGLPEPYSVPLLDYVLYRCQMKDDIDGAAQRSAMHYQQFAAAVGMKLQVEAAHSPNTRR
jgi:hypothetical protein